MKEVEFISHANINNDVLDKIIKIKTVAWPYTYENQKKWINLNINDDDIHVILSDGNCYQAYMNLIKTSVIIDSEEVAVYGIGNVCASEKGRGWGKEIVLAVNQYLDRQNILGILFCKEKLIKFYSENGWYIINHNKLNINGIDETVYCMINKMIKFETLQYKGKLF